MGVEGGVGLGQVADLLDEVLLLFGERVVLAIVVELAQELSQLQPEPHVRHPSLLNECIGVYFYFQDMPPHEQRSTY